MDAACRHPAPTPLLRAGGGYTLIEVMIALAIIAILASVAMPSFFDSIRKSRRSEAVAALSAVQQAQEGRPVEQAGGRVALLALLRLAGQFGILFRGLAAEDHLLAGFALVLGQGELHHRRERVAFDVVRFQLVARRRRFALAHALE